VVIDYADLNPYKGRLAKHRWRHEYGAGVVLASRTKEKFDRDGGGLFVHQLKIVWSAGGQGWFDRATVTLLDGPNTIGDAFVRRPKPL
jgi:hypothetical protein